MNRSRATSEVSIVTFLFAVLVLNPPVLSLFSIDVFFFGIPLLYLYLFAVWSVMIMLIAWIAIGGERGTPKTEPMDGDRKRARGRRRSEHAR